MSSLHTGNLIDQTNDVANHNSTGNNDGIDNDLNHISNNIVNKHLHSANVAHLNSDSINSNGVQNVNTNNLTSSITSSTSAAGYCSNCGVACNILNSSPHGKLCSSCHHHWRYISFIHLLCVLAYI